MTLVDADDPRERDALAAEVAIGLIHEADRRAVEARLRLDTAFAGAVEAWRTRLSDLDDTVVAQAHDEALWTRIVASLLAAPRATPAATPASAQPRGPARHAVLRPKPPSLWDSLAFWRGTGLAAAAAALALAAGLGLMAQRAARTPVLVAVLLTDDNRPAALVNAFADGGAELVPLDSAIIPAGRALQVWTHTVATAPPIPVGLLSRAQSLRLDLRALPRAGPNQPFAVSVEPPGGSPTGQPTGPVILKGSAAAPL